MGVFFVNRIGAHILAGEGFVGGCETPTSFEHVPVHARVGDDVFKTLEFADD